MEIEEVDSLSNSYKLINLSIDSIEETELNNGDVINIYSVDLVMRNAILVTGHAKQPGFLPWRSEMKISDLVSSYDDLLPMTDLNYIIVKREASEGYFNIFQVNLEDMFRELGENKESKENISLMGR